MPLDEGAGTTAGEAVEEAGELCGTTAVVLDAPFPAGATLDDTVAVLDELALGVSVPEDSWLESPLQFPVGFPHPLPPATGHQIVSGSVGDQSEIGGEVTSL